MVPIRSVTGFVFIHERIQRSHFHFRRLDENLLITPLVDPGTELYKRFLPTPGTSSNDEDSWPGDGGYRGVFVYLLRLRSSLDYLPAHYVSVTGMGLPFSHQLFIIPFSCSKALVQGQTSQRPFTLPPLVRASFWDPL